MIKLTVLPPPEQVIEYESEYQIMKAWGISIGEIDHGLKTKKLIRDRFLLNFSPWIVHEIEKELMESSEIVEKLLAEALRDEALAEIVDDYGGEVPREDIRRILGITDMVLRHNINRACKKIAAHPRAREFLYNVREFKERKNMMDYKITTKTKITVTVEE